MFCRCNPDADIRDTRRDYQKQPDQASLERWLNASMRAGQIPVELLLPAIRKIEISAKDAVYNLLRKDISYQKKPAPRWPNSWDQLESVLVTYQHSWDPGATRSTRVSFNQAGDSSFHLQPCGRCDLPSWQQPCPWCGFYPMGPHDYVKRPKTREDFLNHLARTGDRSFFQFYARYQANNRSPEWAPIAASIRNEMLSLGNQYVWPTNEEIWDYFVAGGFRTRTT